MKFNGANGVKFTLPQVMKMVLMIMVYTETFNVDAIKVTLIILCLSNKHNHSMI